MPRPKRNYQVPPEDWVSSLEEYDDRLFRVRMLWRRGGGDYRPMTSESMPKEALDSPDQWEGVELEGAHFDWQGPGDAPPADRHREIYVIAEETWRVAARWTRMQGRWCDFQLCGLDEDGQTLFEVGKRYHLDPPGNSGRVSTDPPVEPRLPVSDVQNVRVGEGTRWLYDRVSEERDKAADERDKMFGQAHAAHQALLDGMKVFPELMGDTSRVLKQVMDEHRVERDVARSQFTAQAQAQAAAIREMEKTKRRENAGKVVVEGIRAASTFMGPVFQAGLKYLTDRKAQTVPEFEVIQQGIVYLVQGMDTPMVKRIFDGDMQMAGAFIGVMDEAGQANTELAAIKILRPMLPVIRSEQLRDEISDEQNVARLFILGRVSIYKIPYYG